MANALIEQTRAAHEDMEVLERLIVKDLKRTMTKHRDRIAQDHRVKSFVDDVQSRAQKLIKIYDDEEGARKAEIAQLGGQNVFSAFYERLKEVRDYHRKFPDTMPYEPANDEDIINSQVKVDFTGEEMNGRYLDLHEHYFTFINSKFGKPRSADETPIEYLTYVQQFTQFHSISRSAKYSAPYTTYLASLLAYLTSFHERTQPLKAVAKLVARAEERFEQQWEAGEVPGWEDQGAGTVPSEEGLVLDVEAFDSVEELEALEGAQLKEALAARNMKSGGTLRQRAERLMLCRGKALSDLPATVFVKGAVPASLQDPARRAKHLAFAHTLASQEARIGAVAESLNAQPGTVIDNTAQWVVKKQAQNYDELKADLEREDLDDAPEGSDAEEEYVYNPLQLPLGPDGKPIPYWLYKLHGLHQEYSCEICANTVYKGRRAYEKHFKESKHLQGMRALGIPMSSAFFEVTAITEAQKLWASLKLKNTGTWNPESHEEFEDEDGNVYNRRTYEDLKRQGLV